MVEANESPAAQVQEENTAAKTTEEVKEGAESTHQVKYKWPPLESDPEIFTQYVQSMGLSPEWAFSELYGFEEEMLGFVPQPVMALILNAEYRKKRAERPQGSLQTVNKYYMKQTGELDNACGVIAALHAVYNSMGESKVSLLPDSVLANFFKQVQSQTPAERATSLENFQAFKKEYRSVANKGQSSQERPTTHHFTAFVVNEAGQLIELCGCKTGPVVIKEASDNVLKDAAAEILRRV